MIFGNITKSKITNLFLLDAIFALTLLVSSICSYFTILEIRSIYDSLSYLDSFLEIITFFCFGKLNSLSHDFTNEVVGLVEANLKNLINETSKICMSSSNNALELLMKSIFSSGASINCSKNILESLFSKRIHEIMYDISINLELHATSIKHIKNLGYKSASLGYSFTLYLFWRYKTIDKYEKLLYDINTIEDLKK